MLCPYRKVTTTKSETYCGETRTTTEERYTECQGEQCPFHSLTHGGCIKVDYAKTIMTNAAKMKAVY